MGINLLLGFIAAIMVRLLLAAVALTALWAQSLAAPVDDVEQALAKRGQFSVILDLLRTANLLDTLKQTPQMTLFAPTNDAFQEIDDQDMQDLKNDIPKLTEFLQYHVTTEEAWHHTRNNSNDRVFKSLNNDLPIRINSYYLVHSVSAEGVNITVRNIPITNGYIQGMDGVMFAPEGDVVDLLNSNVDTGTLAKLVATSGLDAVLKADQNITIFAPTDDAFNDLDPQVLNYLQNNPDLLKEVLLYHVVQKTTLYTIGFRHQMTFPTEDSRHDSLMLLESDDEEEEFFLNNAMVGDRDVSATNGVIHTIEAVLIPPGVLVKLEDQGFGHLIG